MEIEYNKTMVTKVFYLSENSEVKEIYFQEKTLAQEYVRVMNAIAGYEKYHINAWKWEVLIEK